MEEIVLVWTTVPEGFDTESFARELVELRLAACVSVLPLQVSTYRWQGAIETAREHQVLVKTTADRVSAVREALRRLHPYDLPEFLIVPAIGGDEDYLTWVRRSVGP
jgi:periplasmic divalent cation tolerance protein